MKPAFLKSFDSMALAAALTLGALAAEPAMAAPVAAPQAAQAAVSCCTSLTDAIAVVYPTEGNKLCGIVRFKAEGARVHVTGSIYGLAPGSVHGFHIHEFGDASSLDAKSAGGHYNPGGCEHAGPGAPKHHAGDLGNVTAGTDGNAAIDVYLDDVQICGEHGILGRGVILHKNADDLKSQPAGNAGDRIGIGVIGIANPKAPAVPAGHGKVEGSKATEGHHH